MNARCSPCRTLTARQRVDQAVVDYAVRIARATRDWPGIAMGAGSRGPIALVRAAKAAALIAARSFVMPDDVKRGRAYGATAPPHRALRRRPARRPQGSTICCAAILDATAAPRAVSRSDVRPRAPVADADRASSPSSAAMLRRRCAFTRPPRPSSHAPPSARRGMLALFAASLCRLLLSVSIGRARPSTLRRRLPHAFAIGCAGNGAGEHRRIQADSRAPRPATSELRRSDARDSGRLPLRFRGGAAASTRLLDIRS